MDYRNSSHHALLIIHPKRSSVSESIWSELQKESLLHRYVNQSVLDIDTARTLRTWNNTPHAGKKTALISFHTITIPAQNALLKVLEEPNPGVRFIFITSNEAGMLPTLRSRLQEVTHKEEEIVEDSIEEVAAFLQAKPYERMKLAYITKLLQKTDEEGRKDRESVRQFLLTLAQVLTDKKASSSYTLEAVRNASYASLPSSSTKMLLEYMSLLLPQMK